MSTKFRLTTLLIILSLLVFVARFITAADLNTLAFFRAIEDKAAYAKNPTNYDLRVLNGPTGEREYYIEQKPAHVIPRDAVESVIVRQTKRYGSSDEELLKALQEALESSTKRTTQSPGDYPRGVSFNITFKIAPPEAKQFSVFTRNNKQGSFQSRIGRRSVALVQFDLPFEPDKTGHLEFTFYLQEDDTHKVSEMLSPFNGKVVWEK